MQKIIIYTTPVCPYCERVKALFKEKGADYEEVDVSADHQVLMDMVEKSGGRRSVPQIFIGETHVGGADDLYLLESEGKLDGMLGD